MTENAPALQTGNEKKKLTIREMMTDEKHTKMLVQAATGTPLNKERFMRVLSLALQNTPKLQQCDPATLFGAMVACASLGLEPNTPLGQAYLIPFEISKKDANGQWYKVPSVQFIIGYRGYIALARRSGEIVNMHADVVYAGDEFSFEYGSKQHLKHIPKGNREKPLYAYCHATLKDGGEAFEVLPYEQVLKIRDKSQGYQSALRLGKDSKTFLANPWVAHEHEMASKTMVRRLAKFIPMSIEMMRAHELDAFGDHGIGDYSKFAKDRDAAFDELDAGSMTVVGDDEIPSSTPEQPAQETKKAAPKRKAAEPKQVEHKPEQTLQTGTTAQETEKVPAKTAQQKASAHLPPPEPDDSDEDQDGNDFAFGEEE